jgi:hypothetical protein
MSVTAADKAALALKQGRLEFLKIVHGHLKRQEDEGSLRWSSVDTLSYLTDMIHVSERIFCVLVL